MIMDKKIIIADILQKRGVSPGYLGFNCIIHCCEYIIDSNLTYKPYSLSKDVYAHVAKLLRIKTASVEKNIRYAREMADIQQTNSTFIRNIVVDVYALLYEIENAAP